MAAQSAAGQGVRRKHLVMSVGGGIGMINLYSDRKDILVEGLGVGALRAAFGYAITDRWSLGVHYDRVGSTWHNGALDRLHMTNYLFSVGYRPWVGTSAAVEFELALGAMAASLFPVDSRLPYTTTGSAVSLGARYHYMYNTTLGVFLALDHTASGSSELVVDGGLVNADGTRSRIQWNSPRATAGLVVRF
ncbi:MAG: hypothetical protein JNM62_07790 [Flavobacteriales bacterium]|nr:hypothetical protein [Flavobacteriales bacterium]